MLIPNFVGAVQAAAPFILCAIVIALVLIAADSGKWPKRR